VTGGTLAVVLLLGAGPAPTPPTYADAVAPAAAGDARGAAEGLLAFAAAQPSDPDAPEALWDAAALAMDRLADPRLALRALDALVAGFPGSRAGERGRARLAFLEARGIRTDPDALAAWLRLPDEPAALREFLSRHPHFPDADAVRVRLLRVDPTARSEVDPAALQAGDPEVAWRAARAVTAAQLAAGDYEAALASAVRAADSAGEKQARRMLRYQHLARASAAWVALTVLVLFARTQRAGRWRPAPVAVRYFVPVAAALLAMAYPMDPAFRPAMWSLAVGGALLLWVLGASPRRFPRWVRALSHAFTMTAYIYAIVFHFGILPALLETLTRGLQR